PPVPMEPPLPPAAAAGEIQTQSDYEDFLQKNQSVKSLSWNKKNEIIFHLKSGKEERYKLNDEKSNKEAEVKYGKLPEAPPPPPLPPPPPPPPAPPIKTEL
ncbi:MAG: hypothetical protein M3Y85_07710, partial [Bacteroidota bacterium]|nr:hypothetical protein [Bacteroidota bacterium]